MRNRRECVGATYVAPRGVLRYGSHLHDDRFVVSCRIKLSPETDRSGIMYSVRQIGDAEVIEVGGDLDAFSSPDLASAIERSSRSFSQRIVVSLEFCDYCDAAGLAVLVRAKARFGGALRIVVPRANRIRRVFRITHLEDSLALEESLRDAVTVGHSPCTCAYDGTAEIAN